MKKIYFLLAIILLSINSWGQAPTFSWAKQMSGGGNGVSIALDAGGNVYTLGIYSNTVDFDPGIGIFNMTATGGIDIFMSKLDASGNFVWAKSIGGTGSNISTCITTDVSGNILITGQFATTTDFDPNAGVSNLTAIGGGDTFVGKYDSSGNLIWVKQLGRNGSGNSLDTDASGNVYTTGVFSTSGDYDPGAAISTLTPAGGTDIFISKLDVTGNFVWARRIGSTGDERGNAINIDNSGNVYSTGYFSLTVDFNPGAGTNNMTALGGRDIYISKLDASGIFVWAKQLGGTGNDEGYSITTDASSNVYSTGIFGATSDFDPGAGTSNLTAVGSADTYISKLDVSGNFVFAKQIGGTGNDYGMSITLDGADNIYSTGFFSSTSDFDPGVGIFNMTCYGIYDSFISKLDVNGNFIWAGQLGGVDNDQNNSIAVDALGNIYSTGFFSQTSDFDASVGTYNMTSAPAGPGIYNCHVTKYCYSIPSQPVSISGSTTICSGTTNTYSITAVAGATSYTWTLPGGWTGTSTTNSINATASATSGNITVTANNTCGNSSAATLAITVNTIPTTPGTISGTATICSGTTNTYSITAVAGATSYTWTLPSGWTGTSTTNSINATASATSGNITVTANNVCGNSTAQTKAITVSNPVLGISTVPASCFGICDGSATASVAGGISPYSYLWCNGNTTATANSMCAGTCSVSITDNIGCPVNGIATITQPTAVAANVIGTATICTGTCTNLVAAPTGGNGGPYTISWTPGPLSGNPVTVCPVTSTTYTCTAIDGMGCQDTEVVTVTVNPLPVVTYSQSPSLVCVNATSVTLGTVSPTGGTFTGTSVTGSTFNASTAGVGTYSITYTYTDGNGCVNSANSNITVDPCTGISQNTIDNEIVIYPNPTTSVITLGGIDGEAQITLYNVLGKIVLSQQITNDKIEIDLGKETNGIYFIKVSSEKGTVTKRIVKQ